MSMINYASREINCKIVFYGPGLGGKTTNLQYIHRRLDPAPVIRRMAIIAPFIETRNGDFPGALKQPLQG